MKNISIDKLTDIIVQAIREEQFFSKKVLIPKIRALISGFRLNLETANYNQVEDPTKTAQYLRLCQLKDKELKFWKDKMRKVTSKDCMDKYYTELERLRLIWNGE